MYASIVQAVMIVIMWKKLQDQSEHVGRLRRLDYDSDEYDDDHESDEQYRSDTNKLAELQNMTDVITSKKKYYHVARLKQLEIIRQKKMEYERQDHGLIPTSTDKNGLVKD